MLFIIGVLIRLTVRDGLPVVSTIFYATPIPVLTAIALTLLLCTLRAEQKRRRPPLVGWFVITLCCGVWTWQTQWSSHPTPAAERSTDTFRVLFWNVGRGPFGWERTAEAIQQYDADIIGLTEASLTTPQTRAFWSRQFPDYHLTMLGGRFLCLTRGESGIGTAHHLSASAQYRELEITLGTQTVTCVIADLKSNPLYSRREPLAELATVVHQLEDRPVLLMADFNTPSDSVHFGAIRKHMANAFEAAGQGYAPTWPVPLPVLALDQVWVNGQLTPIAARHGWTRVSDHRPVIVDVMFVR